MPGGRPLLSITHNQSVHYLASSGNIMDEPSYTDLTYGTTVAVPKGIRSTVNLLIILQHQDYC